jgi:hypothetical protein
MGGMGTRLRFFEGTFSVKSRQLVSLIRLEEITNF